MFALDRDELLLQTIRSRYPNPIAMAQWQFLGNSGGFSGSRLWKGTSESGKSYGLKLHRSGAMTPTHLSQIQNWMNQARQSGLGFIPDVYANRDGLTVTQIDDRCVELFQWMPGKADFHDDPSDQRLIEIIRAISELHRIWSRHQTKGYCPGITRRLIAIRDWKKRLQSGWTPDFQSPKLAELRDHAQAVWIVMSTLINRFEPQLNRWSACEVNLQPCVCDIWHDHLLLEGDLVCGIIDFAATKIDHITVDLARLLGSLLPHEPERRQFAIREYLALNPFTETELVELLDESGTLVGLINWLKWIYVDHRDFHDIAMVVNRFKLLSDRVLRMAVSRS